MSANKFTENSKNIVSNENHIIYNRKYIGIDNDLIKLGKLFDSLNLSDNLNEQFNTELFLLNEIKNTDYIQFILGNKKSDLNLNTIENYKNDFYLLLKEKNIENIELISEKINILTSNNEKYFIISPNKYFPLISAVIVNMNIIKPEYKKYGHIIQAYNKLLNEYEKSVEFYSTCEDKKFVKKVLKDQENNILEFMNKNPDLNIFVNNQKIINNFIIENGFDKEINIICSHYLKKNTNSNIKNEESKSDDNKFSTNLLKL